jgi:predicted nucleotidyltransferase
MPQQTVVKIIQRFLREVERAGIPVYAGVLYGSYARGDAHRVSDIDLLVISKPSRAKKPRQDAEMLWRLRARVDYRLEPLLVAKSKWDHDDGSPMLAAIRQEGRLIRRWR